MWNRTPKDENKPGESFYPEATHIGKSIVIKGEVSGSENVYLAASALTCKRAASWFRVEWTEPCTAPRALI